MKLYMQWRHLLFLHWRYPVEDLQARLPSGLQVDTFEETAYVAIVPFFMRQVHPGGFPCVPGLSDFAELNLRTYVRGPEGVPGVWFFSLECHQPLAVWLARTFFHLNYVHARMQTRQDNGVIDYRCVRKGSGEYVGHYQYHGYGPTFKAESDSLEHFLVERYVLYAANRQGRLFRGCVYHEPYTLQQAEVTQYDTRLFTANGLNAPEHPPDHILYAPGVDVTADRIQRVTL